MRTLRPAHRSMIPRVDCLEVRQLLSVTPGHHSPAQLMHSTMPASTSLVQHQAVRSSSTVNGLTISPSPTVTRSFLNATTAIAVNDIWAVGFINLAPNPQKLLAEHWNGSSWTVVATPNPPGAGASQFHGVAAAAGNDVWAVGQTVSSDANGSPHFNPLIEHWNGSAWSVVAAPSPAGGGVLNAVTVISSTNVWAVGYGNGVGTQNLVEHWDGTRWSIVAAPSTSTRDALLGVSGTSATDVWAVGRSFRHPSVEVLHFDGHTWSNVSAPSPFFDSVLTSVTALAPNNVWAVGVTDVGPTQTLIEHWDGTSWTVVPSPNPNADSSFGANALTGIAAVSAKDIWAVGNTTDPNSGFERTLTLHWNGSSWTTVASPNATSGQNTLAGVTALVDGTVVAVGTAGDATTGNTNGLILKK